MPKFPATVSTWNYGNRARKVAGEVQACDWLDYREAARRFWLVHANQLPSIGDVQTATSARFRMFAIWPEGELESRMVRPKARMRGSKTYPPGAGDAAKANIPCPGKRVS